MVQTKNWHIDPSRTALIITDMQRVFCDKEGTLYVKNTEHIIQSILDLRETADALKIPVIYLRHTVRGDGSDTGRMKDLYPDVDEVLDENSSMIQIIPELAPRSQDIIVDKPYFSGFVGTDLDTILRANDINTLMVTGTVTNVCCESTVRDAAQKEYKVWFISDANAAMDYPDMGWGALTAEDIQRVTLTTIAYEFGKVVDSSSVQDELLSATKNQLAKG